MPTSETMTDAPPGPERQVSLPALPATPLLIDEEPLLVPPRLAAAIGLNEAIVLQQIRYWLGDKRRPKIRDGRRWVYNTYPQWQAQFPFWSLATIKKTFRELEERGLLLASQRYNRAPTDRTKWYTIDFPRLLALDAALAAPEDLPRDQFNPLEGRDRDIGRDQIDPLRREQINPLQGIALTPSNQRLPTEITTENTQQQYAEPPPITVRAERRDDRVVVDPAPSVQALTGRGVTAGVARRLVADHAPAAVARQVEYHDHERAADPADPRLTPGRLRRRIEGDWAPPPDFVPPAEHARRDAEEARRHADAHAAHVAEDERRRREHAATLAAVGATAADQAAWHALLTSPTPLPSLFRTALFRAPREGCSPVIILRTAAERDRAIGGAYAKERQELERRLRARFPAHARAAPTSEGRVRYAACDECAAECNRDGETGRDAAGRIPQTDSCHSDTGRASPDICARSVPITGATKRPGTPRGTPAPRRRPGGSGDG